MSKPLVIWSPEYGSAYRWAKDKKFTVISNNTSPDALRETIIDMVGNAQKLAAINTAASQELFNEFVPSAIQAEFLEHVEKIAR